MELGITEAERSEQEVRDITHFLRFLAPPPPGEVSEAAVAGETYEYTEMYPKFRHLAVEEGNASAVKEFDEQIAESKEHAENFRRTLEKAARRFAALAKVEERHANQYRSALAKARA